jgi:GNAT superfamily N-acetyltransferase
MIRTATATDIPALITLVNAAYAVESFLEGTRTDAERLTADLANGQILVAEGWDGELLASVYIETRGPVGYMGLLAVDPARQGTGLARRVYQAAEERFREQGLAAIEIHVLSLRPELLPIYQRFGFVETGVKEFNHGRIFKDGGSAHLIVMTRRL